MVVTELKEEVLHLLNAALGRALMRTAEEILTREGAAQVMPMDTGRMQNAQTYVDSSRAAEGSVRIVTDAPQAARLYYHPEYHFRRDKNATAQGEWWEPWITGSRRNEAAALFTASAKEQVKEIVR